jgi:hypothetical protein
MLPFSDSSYVCKSETRKCVASLRRDVSRDSRVVNSKKESVSVVHDEKFVAPPF